MEIITTIIDCIPPEVGVEYLTVSEAPSVPQDASESQAVPKDAVWQRRTGNRFLLIRKKLWEPRDAYLFEVDPGSIIPLAAGRFWSRDAYGWQLVGPASFNLGAWEFSDVDVVFDPDLDPSSVRILRPCQTKPTAYCLD